jgi:hypothetical protein
MSSEPTDDLVEHMAWAIVASRVPTTWCAIDLDLVKADARAALTAYRSHPATVAGDMRVADLVRRFDKVEAERDEALRNLDAARQAPQLGETITVEATPWTQNHRCDGRDDGPAQAATIAKGCVCPPTSEQTCQRWDCGRKTPRLDFGFAGNGGSLHKAAP